MTDFEQRLRKAIERGQRAGDARARAEAQKALSESEIRGLHTLYRVELCEHIETCLKQLTQHFPGFAMETIVSDRGWGAAVSRDDVQLRPGRRRNNYFSRLEVVVRPASKYHVLDLGAKGTIRNKEVFRRSHFRQITEVDLAGFTELIDVWVLEYAELYAAKS
jgi:hypothetical protein